MNDQPDKPIVIESDLQGTVNGVPGIIHKIETRHSNGRIDCHLSVPKLSTKATSK